MKGAAHLPEAFLDPKLSHSVEPNETPWNTAFGTDMGLFEWYNQKENVARSQRFGIALAGTTKMEPATAILTGNVFLYLFHAFTELIRTDTLQASSGKNCRRVARSWMWAVAWGLHLSSSQKLFLTSTSSSKIVRPPLRMPKR